MLKFKPQIFSLLVIFLFSAQQVRAQDPFIFVGQPIMISADLLPPSIPAINTITPASTSASVAFSADWTGAAESNVLEIIISAAQTNGPVCDTYTNQTTENGLAGNTVNGVYASGSTVYVATTGGGLSISTDGGTTFINMTTTNGLGNSNVKGVYASGSTVYAATTGGLSISTDGGATFTNKTTLNGLGSSIVNGVYAIGSSVYAATTGGLSISTDGGATFTNKTTANGLGSSIVSGVYAIGSSVYAATTGGLSISTDGGATFTNNTTTNGLGNSNVFGVYAIGSSVYAATNGGLSISTDGGATFTNKTTSNGLGNSSVRGVYASGSTVYAATTFGLSISTDGGTTFINMTTTNGLGSSIVRSVYATGSTIYAGTSGGLSFCSPQACTPPSSGGTIATAQSGTSPFNPAAFTSSAAASGETGTLEYKWQSSTTSNSAGFSDISSSNAATYDAGALTVTTWFKRLARVDCSADWTGAAESNVLEVTVIQSSPPTASAQTFCNGATVANLVATGTDLKWYDVASGGTALVSTTALATGTYYVSQTVSGNESDRTSVEVTVTPSTTTGSVTTSACDSYTWAANGVTYTSSQTNLTHIVGCNTATLNLTITAQLQWYLDADSDGYYTGAAISSCVSPGSGYTITVIGGNDCDDANALVWRTGSFYVDADADGYSPNASSETLCYGASTPSGYGVGSLGLDCDDAVAAVNPGQTEILYNGVDDNCDGQLDEGFQLTTTLQSVSCGATVPSMGSLIYANINNTASGYRFKVVNNTTGATQTINRSFHWFALNMLADYDYATTYTISVELQKAGIWLGYYGTTCAVSSPAILSPTGALQVNPSQCGATLASIGSVVSTTPVSGATGYRFRVTDVTPGATGDNLVQVKDRSYHWFTLPMLNRFNYGSTYLVEVAVKTTAGYSAYGSACTIISPAVPTLVDCGGVIATDYSLVRTSPLNRISQYRFQVTKVSGQSAVTFDTNKHWFSFRVNVPGFTSGAQYAVRIAVMTAGTWSPFGDACEITAPTAVARVNEVAANEFTVEAYPNPYSTEFKLNVTTSAEGAVALKVYDMLGKLIETRSINTIDYISEDLGSAYPAGVYNVIVSQGEQTKTLRLIKR